LSVIAYETFNDTKIQVIEEDGDLWFPAVNIAKALGYANPNQAVYDIITRNPEDFQKNSRISKLLMHDKMREIRILNEKGVYVFCMLARTAKSVSFRRWVSNIIQLHRKKNAPVNKVNTLTALESIHRFNEGVLVALQEQERRLRRLEELTRASYIDRYQAFEIKKKIQNLAYLLAELEGKENPTRIHFTKLWTNFNNTFRIPSYKDLPKVSFSDALELLDSWKERIEEELME